VIDFADDLRSKYAADALQRGSVEAILQALERVGPLQFAPGELDTLLAEIRTMREDDKHFTFVDGITVENWRV